MRRFSSGKTRMIFILIALALVQVYGQPVKTGVSTSDPFLPYLTGKPPVIREDLGIETMPDGLSIHRFVFLSRMIETPEGKLPSLVYGAIVHPKGPGPYPAVVRLHGGGGIADIPAAISSAKEGYVSLVIDIPAISGKDKSPKNTFPWKLREGIGANPDASYSSFFDAVLASVQSFYLLRSQPDVDKNKIAIAGASWGGYTATMVAGILDKEIAATYSAFGSGNFMKGAFEKTHLEQLPDAEREEWLKYLDPGSRAHHITKPYLIATASNDRHWSWMAVQATLAEMKGPTHQFYSPNDNHMMKYQGSSLMIPFLNHYLKGGPALPSVVLGKSMRLSNGALQVNYKVKNAANLSASKVFYTYPLEQPVWTERIWSSVNAKANNKGYQAVIPASSKVKAVNWYVLITDNHPELGKDTVSVSSLIQETK